VTVDGDDIAPLEPHVTGGSFLNFLKDPSRTRDAYTASDLARLLELKRAYDPDNVFGVGRDIVSPRSVRRSCRVTAARIAPGRGRPETKKPRDLRGFLMRRRGLEPPRAIQPTRPSTLRVYQFRHRRRWGRGACRGRTRV
jgi:Berberine and berberine like